MISLTASAGFELGPFCADFVCSSHACVGFSPVLQIDSIDNK